MTPEADRIDPELNQSRRKLSDTLDSLGNTLSPNQIASEVTDMAKHQAQMIANGVTRQVRDNPVPLLLIGAGIALYAYNASRKSSNFSADEDASWPTPRLANETDETYNERVHEAYAAALGLKRKSGEALSAFKSRVLRAAESTKVASADTRERISDAMSDGAHYVSDKATGSARYISHKARDGAEYVGRMASQARHATEDAYRENPLAIGAVLLGVGALIGVLAPLSQPEREGLRGVANKAARAGANLADRGARMVEDRIDGAVH